VTDTHAIIWHLVAPMKLAANADLAFDQADAGEAEIHIPAVVLAEMMMVAAKERVPDRGLAEVQRFVQTASASSNYRLSALTPDIVVASAGLPEIPDIFDRLIAAEALATAASLISRDQIFSKVSNLNGVWPKTVRAAAGRPANGIRGSWRPTAPPSVALRRHNASAKADARPKAPSRGFQPPGAPRRLGRFLARPT